MNRDMNYYIGRQAVALENTLQSRKTLGENFCSQWKAVCPDRLYLVGSGTSGNAVRAAAPFMQEVLGVETMAICPKASFCICFARRVLHQHPACNGNDAAVAGGDAHRG